jgi:hypothetical protein
MSVKAWPSPGHRKRKARSASSHPSQGAPGLVLSLHAAGRARAPPIAGVDVVERATSSRSSRLRLLRARTRTPPRRHAPWPVTLPAALARGRANSGPIASASHRDRHRIAHLHRAARRRMRQIATGQRYRQYLLMAASLFTLATASDLALCPEEIQGLSGSSRWFRPRMDRGDPPSSLTPVVTGSPRTFPLLRTRATSTWNLPPRIRFNAIRVGHRRREPAEGVAPWRGRLVVEGERRVARAVESLKVLEEAYQDLVAWGKVPSVARGAQHVGPLLGRRRAMVSA